MKTQAQTTSSQSRELLEFIHAMTWQDVPAPLLHRTKNCLLDSLACGLFGTVQPWSIIIADEMIADGSRGHATILGRRQTVSAPAAALCNGTATHGFELDDILDRTVGHPGAIVIPAALAVAEEVNAPGEQLLLGIFAGYEAMNRVGLAVGLQPTKQGFHKTSIFGPVAAAIAAGIVMDLTLEQLTAAVGLACSTASGIKSFSAGTGGGMMKRLHAGRSAESGVRMAQLAARNFTAPPTALDGHFGLLQVFGGSGADAHELTRDLGARWAMERIFVKLHPCCGWVQSTIDAATQLRGATPIDPGAVQHVKIGVSTYVTKNNGAVTPPDTMGAQYSLPYCAALALTADADDFSMYEGQALNDPARRALAQRVELTVDPEAEALYPHHSAVRFELTLRTGERRAVFMVDPKGAADNPCTDEELVGKFSRLSSRVVRPDIVSALRKAISTADTAKSARELTALLREQSFAATSIQ